MAEGGAGLIERGGARAKGENIVGVLIEYQYLPLDCN